MTIYRTEKVQGEVEIFHIWGRTTVMPVKAAILQLHGPTIRVYAETDQPILDGEQRTDYHMSPLDGVANTDFPTQIQLITGRESSVLPTDQRIHQTKTAMISLQEGEPLSLVFTSIEYALFDVKAYNEKSVDDPLLGFNEFNFRTRTFQAIFDDQNDIS